MMNANLFHEKELNAMKSITLDYVYSDLTALPHKTVYHVSSESIDFHSIILLNMMEEGLILQDSFVYQMLNQLKFYGAAHLLVKRQDMIMQIKTIAPYFPGYGICYCPSVLSEIEKIYLRKWYEFFQLTKGTLTISQHKEEENLKYESPILAQKFLEEEQILNDTYMRSLIRKYSDLD